jgi:hypothetical protein
MENLHVQQKGSVQITEHEIDFTFDSNFKQGLHKQVDAFINGNKNHICNSKNIYSRIIN